MPAVTRTRSRRSKRARRPHPGDPGGEPAPGSQAGPPIDRIWAARRPRRPSLSMGIEKRDYLRSEGRSSFGGTFGGGLQTVKWIIGVNVAVFVLQVLTARSGIVTEALALSPGSVLERLQVWRLVTYAFCHSPFTVWHIFFNMFILWLVGRRLEPRYGSREFLLFYLGAVVVSGLVYVLLELVLARPGVAIGASGAVAAAFILFAILYPYERWLLFFVIPVEVRWLCAAYVIFDIHPVLL